MELIVTALIPDAGHGRRRQPSSANGSDGQTVERRGIGVSLSTKLLLLTILFVMVAEVLISVPSVSNFRKNWLMERLVAAQIAALAVEAAPHEALPDRLRSELLNTAMVHAVALKRDAFRLLVLEAEMPDKIDEHFDMRDASWAKLISDALYVFISPQDRMIRVVDKPLFGGGDSIEIVMNERPLKEAMLRFGLNIFGLSIIISVMTATLVYLSLNALLVRPIRRITSNMMDFRDNPEDQNRIIAASQRSDEIGVTERELQAMQRELVSMLRQKTRLAALGLAVSKISHDLRNMLSSAQLISDRLSKISDPNVQRFAPKLISSLDRAIHLCTDTLKYGRAEEPPPKRTMFALLPLIQEVAEALELPRDGIAWKVDVPANLEVDADRGQVYRVISNLVRNACEALEAAQPAAGGAITVKAWRDGPVVHLSVSDNGPGVPSQVREHLFAPFHGSARKNGTGLGLAIAAELVRAHGGKIILVSNEGGATFQVDIPDRS